MYTYTYMHTYTNIHHNIQTHLVYINITDTNTYRENNAQ